MKPIDSQSDGCSEYRALERRDFVRTLGRLGAAAVVSAPAWLPKLAFARDENSSRDLIVCVFLRGGADGLSLVVPHGDAGYYRARPSLAVPRPDDRGSRVAVDLDGFFGLAPGLASFKPIYDAGQLAIVHAVGSPDPTRSHFEAQDFMENGTPGDGTTLTGWLGRHLQDVGTSADGPLRGLAASYTIPRSLSGAPATVAVPSIAEYGLVGRPETGDERLGWMSSVYGQSDEPVRTAAANVTDTIKLIQQVGSSGYTPASGAVYPQGEWGLGLQTIAQLAKADVGLEAACIDLDGWDTHAVQGPLTGKLDALCTTLSTGLAAFHADMSDRLDRTTVVVMSEFGRRVAENGSAGTDHGHGSCMFVLGGNVNGGRVHGDWPGLQRDQLDNERDLAITTDFRDVLSEILEKRAGNPGPASVFPGFTPTFPGVVA
jgi:uncharacterized protein (DUF1501 family)